MHLLRFGGSPEEIAPLASAVAAEGLRIGWLDLAGEAPTDRSGKPEDGEQEAPGRRDGSGSPALDEAVSAGAFRAVGVSPGRTVALKALLGPPVLRDLLREHFLGCTLVVVRVDPGADGQREGATGTASPAGPPVRDVEGTLDEAPRLVSDGDRFRVDPPGRAGRRWTAAELAARLRKPRPWE